MWYKKNKLYYILSFIFCNTIYNSFLLALFSNFSGFKFFFPDSVFKFNFSGFFRFEIYFFRIFPVLNLIFPDFILKFNFSGFLFEIYFFRIFPDFSGFKFNFSGFRFEI